MTQNSGKMAVLGIRINLRELCADFSVRILLKTRHHGTGSFFDSGNTYQGYDSRHVLRDICTKFFRRFQIQNWNQNPEWEFRYLWTVFQNNLGKTYIFVRLLFLGIGTTSVVLTLVALVALVVFSFLLVTTTFFIPPATKATSIGGGDNFVAIKTEHFCTSSIKTG